MSKPIEERVKRFLGLYPHEIAFPLVRDLWEYACKWKSRALAAEKENKKLHDMLDNIYGEG